MSQVVIRNIEKEDNPTIATIIRGTLKEFGADHPGTVYFDETTDDLYSLFKTPQSVYFIATLDGEIVGGAGIFPSAGLENDTCELVKMYLITAVRGKGIASDLIGRCIEKAKEFGFKKIYLESMPELKTALQMYEKKGWKYLPHALGNTGHDGCGLWMLLNLED